MITKNYFVFVVCGADEQIKTLNFSIKYLRHFSGNNILVVTDKKRNNIEIDHDKVLDIHTPEHFDHHQASIYLKTGLHKFVDLSTNYCYLDSDVIALSPNVDDIFQHSYGPVTFAADHCTMESFSSNAVNCGCSERKKEDLDTFVNAVKRILPDYEHDSIFNNKIGRELYRILIEIKNNPLKRAGMIVDYLMLKYGLKNSIKSKNGLVFKYSRKKKGWIDIDGNLIMYNLTALSSKLKKSSEFSFSKWKRTWTDKNGENIFSVKCGHLAEQIKQKFDIDVTQKNFQHWNGGVFLFNKESTDFLNTWHQLTMEIFADKNWKTRDQGTLIATVWKHNLQYQKLLPQEFNFIADFNNPRITYSNSKGFTYDNFKTLIVPNLIHVYHQFGNRDWEVWQGIENILN